MSLAGFHVRRATLDDIVPLTALWQTMQFPVDDLARRITEFQVALSAEERVLGAVGLQILDKQGLIHSEGFTDFSLSEELRPAIWNRFNTLATSQGLVRFWTQETAPFYRRCGMERGSPDNLAELPDAWQQHGGEWLTLKLRERLETLVSADKEFELFMALEKAKTQRTMVQGKALKTAAQILAVILCLAVIGGFIYLAQHRNLFQNH